MKINFIKAVITFVVILVGASVFSLKTKEEYRQKIFDEDSTIVDSNRIPTIHINMEDHESDPINFRRFDGERKTYNMRANELLEKYENEKRALTGVITIQSSKIAQLTEIADATNKIIEFLVAESQKRS